MQVSFDDWQSGLRRVWPGRRAHLPLRVAPMLLVGMILLVLGVLSTAAF
ncbi:hypothetical protein U3A55_13250 [Salarchaeum sp. III]